jgi:hypothetical protein
LRAERDIEFDALDIERVVELVVRRQLPEPWHDAQSFEAELADGAVLT